MKKRLLWLAISIIVFASLCVPVQAQTWGSYGVDLTSDSYDYRVNPYAWPQCTWYAWGRAREKLGITLSDGIWDHARYWADYASAAGFAVGDTPRANSIFVENWYLPGTDTPDTYGHVSFIEKIEGDYAYYSDSNYNGEEYYEGKFNTSTWMNYRDNREVGYLGYYRKFIYLDGGQETTGTEMSQGYDRVLPDGDYIIAAYDNPLYFLDIIGATYPTNNTLAQLYKVDSLDDISVYDIWTVTYNSSTKFYTITQKGTDMCLDVQGAGLAAGDKAQAYSMNGPYANPKTYNWAISKDDNEAYRLQVRSSGFYLDMKSGIGNGMEIRAWTYSTTTNDQSWVFIPYKPSQTLSAGKYVFASSADTSYVIGYDSSNNNAQLAADNSNYQYTCFEITPLSNGYYKVIDSESGKALTVDNGSRAQRANISVSTYTGSSAQQWAFIKNGSYYMIWSRCSGKVIDMVGYTPSTGVNVFQYFYNGDSVQKWKPIKSEYAITYTADGATNVPSNQVKHYKNSTTISSQIPQKEGYEFDYWEDILSLDEDLNTVHYAPGETYTVDEPLALYAVWHEAVYDYTITYDANGGVNPPAPQHCTTRSVELSSGIPSRTGYDFLGWATSPTATVAQYQPGNQYPFGEDITLYALWDVSNAPAESIPIDAAHFPEESFRRYVSEEWIDKNQDGLLSLEERNAVKYILHDEEWTYRLYSLQGIEYFPNLERLICYWNLITDVDLSQNKKLTQIAIMYNPLDVLDVSSCPSLVEACATAERRQLIDECDDLDRIGPLEVDKRTTVIAGSKVFPARATNPATITKAPIAKTLIYNGEMQELVTAGEVENGWCLYGTDNPAYGFYSEIPRAKDVGEYTVYYRAYGDETHYTSDAVAITAKILPAGTVAQGTCGDSITWLLDNTGKLIISGTGAMQGDHAWSYGWEEYRDQIYTIEIENGITSIGDWAFWGERNLTSVTIASSVTTIGDYAFDCCSVLPSILLPDTVTSIGDCAFRYCSALSSVNLPRSLVSIGDFVFMSFPEIVTINIPNGMQMTQHVRLYEGTLCTLSLPASITEIGEGAFLCTTIPVAMNISPDFCLPDSIHTIESEAFSGISATFVYIPENKNGKTIIGDRAFANCSQLQYIWIGDCSEIEISNTAFAGCNSNLTIIDDAESVVDTIYEYAVEHGIEWIGNEYYMGDG